MEFEVLLALFTKVIDQRLEDLPRFRGQRGKPGRAGADGKSFVWEEHEQDIKQWAKEFALKFEDLSDDQRDALRGARGADGRDGTDGRGFVFEEHKAEIESVLSESLSAAREDFRLKFEDLSESERELLRGPQGRKGLAGRDGKDFDFEEHKDFFLGLKPKFSDFTDEERAQLVLRFSHLSDEEKSSLKLKFEDLTDEEKITLKGPRGQRGKPGQTGQPGETGARGETGKTGPRGVPGLPGISGRTGLDGTDGLDGRDGRDAPYVTDIRVYQNRERIKFTFEFSDGGEIETRYVDLPEGGTYFVGGFAGGGSGSSGGGPGTPGADGKSAYDLWIDEGNTGDVADFLLSLQGPAGLDGPAGDDGKSAYEIWLDHGNVGTEQEFLDSLVGPAGSGGGGADDLQTYQCDATVYPGAAVVLRNQNIVIDNIIEWPTLQAVVALESLDYDTVAYNGIATTYENSNVIGIVESKPSSTSCLVRRFGTTTRSYFGLDVRKEYFLSAESPGLIVPDYSKPDVIGEYVVRVGQPANSRKLSVSKGDIRRVSVDTTVENPLGWIFVQDSQYTEASPFVSLAGIPMTLPNDNLGPLSSRTFGTPISSSWYNASTNRYYPEESGDYFLYRVNMTLVPTINNKSVEITFDIGTANPLWQQSETFTKGAGVPVKRSFVIPISASGNFVSTGGRIRILAETDVNIYRISTTIFKAFRR